MIVRDARKEDFQALLRLGRIMKDETRVPFPSVDEGWAQTYFEVGLDNPGVCICLVAENKGRAVGMLLAWLNSRCWSPKQVSSVELLFVEPGSRGLAAAAALVRRYEQEARKRGVSPSDIWINVSTGIDLGKLVSRWGYKYEGGNYRKCVVVD